MLRWSESSKLRELSLFYAKLRETPGAITDEQVVQMIRSTFWSANCWSFVEAAFAIISPACAMRPHLTKLLIEEPIRAMVYGGLEDPGAVVTQGLALAGKPDPEVELTLEGKKWLLEEWPKFEAVARQVFQEIQDETAGS
ncbi:hypothetical protein ACEN8I_02015 [Polaromonas sp. CT11-55]|uniref:hypothetical protein n=1 Tax=Polaromonas sp. CT11-55 TaxID=3243045 RepID=UPI0039A72E47